MDDAFDDRRGMKRRTIQEIFSYPVGSTFWFIRNRFLGSYVFLIATSLS